MLRRNSDHSPKATGLAMLGLLSLVGSVALALPKRGVPSGGVKGQALLATCRPKLPRGVRCQPQMWHTLQRLQQTSINSITNRQLRHLFARRTRGSTNVMESGILVGVSPAGFAGRA